MLPDGGQFVGDANGQMDGTCCTPPTPRYTKLVEGDATLTASGGFVSEPISVGAYREAVVYLRPIPTRFVVVICLYRSGFTRIRGCGSMAPTRPRPSYGGPAQRRFMHVSLCGRRRCFWSEPALTESRQAFAHQSGFPNRSCFRASMSLC